MEAVPNKSEDLEPKAHGLPDPEIIGDILLRHEIPSLKQFEAAPEEVINISHEPLSPAETSPDLTDLPESHFDSRHEVVSQDTLPIVTTTSAKPSEPNPDNLSKDTSFTTPVTAGLSPPPMIMPTESNLGQQSTKSYDYKKPVVYGLLVGAIMSVAMLAIFFR